MPETVRTTGGRHSAHRRRRGLSAFPGLFPSMVGACPLILGAVPADAATGLRDFDNYRDSFSALDGGGIATMTLTLGVLLFAVVTAIMLVRTRIRAAVTDTAQRDQIVTLMAERDRFNALLLSEPQILVSWAAADNQPDILSDTSLVTN